jgi:putative FmdB family regulatory protein
MPIYEFRCRDCRKKSTFVTLSVRAAFELKCQHCGSTALDRLVSRVAVHRSEESRMDGLADPAALSGLDENDPKSMARWMKKMGKEMGEDAGEDFEQDIDQAMAETGDGPGREADAADGGDVDGGGDGGEDL